jgi:uncharacterized protein (TIGR02598 family)
MKNNFVRAFTLVEVVVALGLFSFCIVAIVGLFSVALGSTRSVANEAAVENLVDSIYGGWSVQKNANISLSMNPIFNNLPALTSGSQSTMYFNDQGIQVDSAESASFLMDYKPEVIDAGKGYYSLALTFRWPPVATANENSSIQSRFFTRTFVK